MCLQRLISLFTCFSFEILARIIVLQTVVLKFIKYYFPLRWQQFIIIGCLSDDVLIRTSVPHGSVLGPLIFLLHAEDRLKELGINCPSYADDTVLNFIFGSNLSHFMFDVINLNLTLVQQCKTENESAKRVSIFLVGYVKL